MIVIEILIYLIFFLGFLVQSIGGFGGGLLAVPLLTLVEEPRFIVPVFSLTVFVLNVVIAFETRENINWPRVSRIVLSSWPGLFLGVYLLANLNQDIIRFFISLTTLVMGFLFWFGVKLPIRDAPGSYTGAGLISGVLSGSAAMGGPPLIIMGYTLGWSKDEFRATLLACFAINGMVSMVLFYLNGLLHVKNITIVPFALIPALIAVVLGLIIKNSLDQKWFSRITLILIITIGMIGIARFFV